MFTIPQENHHFYRWLLNIPLPDGSFMALFYTEKKRVTPKHNEEQAV
jgi:hypothetical protein